MTAPIGYPEQFGTLLARQPSSAQGPAGGQLVKQPGAENGSGSKTTLEGPTFAEHLSEFVADVDQTQKSAKHSSEEFAVGHQNDVHGTMIAVEQADISLRLLANVRNRVVDLYREVMRMGS